MKRSDWSVSSNAGNHVEFLTGTPQTARHISSRIPISVPSYRSDSWIQRRGCQGPSSTHPYIYTVVYLWLNLHVPIVSTTPSSISPCLLHSERKALSQQIQWHNFEHKIIQIVPGV